MFGRRSLPVSKFSRSWPALALAGAALAPAVLPTIARAQSAPPVLPPAADPALQEQERLRREQLQQQREAAPPAKREDKPAAATDEGPSFVLQRVRFSASRHLQREQLATLTQPLLGRPIRWSDLQALLERVNQLYRELGIYTAAATLPEQQVQDGTVVVQLVEGRVGQVLVAENAYLSDGWVRGWVGGVQPGGDVDARRLEADLARFNRINDARLQASLKAGQAFGETDLVLAVQEPARTSGQVFIDNFGYASTGRAEAGVALRRQAVLTEGDRVAGHLSGSQGTRALSLSYSAPAGTSSWRFGGSASTSTTRMVAGDFAALNVKGSGHSVGLDASVLAHSADSWWWSATGSVQVADSGNDVAGAAVSRYQVTRVNLGAPLTVTGTGWQWSFNPVLTQARARNRLLPDQSVNATLFTGDSTLAWRFARDWYVLGQLSWQLSNRKGLPGALAFSVGGPVSVRGYEPGQISGDEGFTTGWELHADGWSPGGTRVDLFAFVDTSEVRSINPRVRPTAAGLGANWSGWSGLTLSVTAGRELSTVVPEQRGWHAYARLSRSF